MLIESGECQLSFISIIKVFKKVREYFLADNLFECDLKQVETMDVAIFELAKEKDSA